MNTRISAVSLFGALSAVFFMYAAPAQAQATRTWVSGVGDDVNPCSRTAPCKTFAGAISKTAINGEINCIDSGGFGGVTITKSITIDCKTIEAGVLVVATSGVTINFNSPNFTGANDQKSVRLRGLDINGAQGASGSGTNGIRIIGPANVTDTKVFIEDVIIDGMFTAPARGISDERLGGGKLFVANTVVRNIGTFGIIVGPASSSTAVTKVDLHNVKVFHVNDNQFSANVKATIRRSVFSGNAGIGVFSSSSQVHLSESVVSHNGNGVFTAAGGTLTMSDVDLVFNDTAIGGGAVSFGNNRITGNTSAGVAPTAASPGLQ